MLRKIEKEAIHLFYKANEDVIKSNIINIYRLAATIEQIEQRVNQNKKIA